MESHVSLDLPAQQPNDKAIKSAAIPILQLTAIWLFLRFLTSLVVASISPLYPKTAIEKSIAIWPPAQNILAWLDRIFVAPWYRWDAILFGRILTHGYTPWDGTTSFNPLFPLLSWPLYKLGLDPTMSLLVTSSLAALGLFWVFYRLATLDHTPATAWTALLFLVTFPAAFILFAPYSESLFLLWTVLALYTMRRGRWGWLRFAVFWRHCPANKAFFLQSQSPGGPGKPPKDPCAE